MVLVAQHGHPLALRRQVDAHELCDIPLLRRESGSGTQTLVDTVLQRAGVNAPTLMELGSPEALKQAVLHALPDEADERSPLDIFFLFVHRQSLQEEILLEDRQHPRLASDVIHDDQAEEYAGYKNVEDCQDFSECTHEGPLPIHHGPASI